MGKILIIPDTHGRRFWEDSCLNHKNEFEKIVFLGDFVSPYPAEGITNEAAIEVLKEIVNFKKENGDKVILLLGNHRENFAF
jgi:predicted phosphodiesterase